MSTKANHYDGGRHFGLEWHLNVMEWRQGDEWESFVDFTAVDGDLGLIVGPVPTDDAWFAQLEVYNRNDLIHEEAIGVYESPLAAMRACRLFLNESEEADARAEQQIEAAMQQAWSSRYEYDEEARMEADRYERDMWRMAP